MIIGINDLIIREARTDEEMNAVMDIRKKVFIEEQNVPGEIERDGNDDEAWHFIALYRGVISGCGRVRYIDNCFKIERLAVIKKYRGRKIASRLLDYIVQQCRNENVDCVILNSQYYLSEFYRKHGFESVGHPFEEAGIKHIKMVKYSG